MKRHTIAVSKGFGDVKGPHKDLVHSFTYTAGSSYLKIAKHMQSSLTPAQMRSRLGTTLPE